MSIIKLYITVNDTDGDLLKRYDRVKVWRATTFSGTYSEITTAATRIELVPGLAAYTFYDEAGDSTYWYKTSFFNSHTSASGALSDPYQGDDSITLSSILTVQNLKDVFLTGVDLTDDAGNPYPDIMFEFSIRMAIGWLERQLDLEVLPVDHIDRYDYNGADFIQWAFLQLDHYPVISVSDLRLFWPSASESIEFPDEWYAVEYSAGQINLVPTSGTLSQAMAIGGAYLPTILSSIPFIPLGMQVTYQSGFAPGTLPYDLRYLIGMRASYPILNTAGDLIAGAGIANLSIGIDGLSQSIGTTSSATNSGYGARLVQYSKEIKELIPRARKFYKNVGLAMA